MQAALNGEWKETYAKQVSLPKAKPSEYEVYLEWLYTNHFSVLDKSSDRGMTLVRLYLLGDHLGDDRFTNAVIDTIVREISSANPAISFSRADLSTVWRNTTPNSMLRKVLSDLIVHDIGTSTHQPLFYQKGSWSLEVSAQILTQMVESKQVTASMYAQIFAQMQNDGIFKKALSASAEHPSVKKDKCEYHKHEDGDSGCIADQ